MFLKSLLFQLSVWIDKIKRICDWHKHGLRSNTLTTWCEEPTHWKRPWCWERLRAGEEGDRGWDSSMVLPTQWTWVWINSGRWWRTGKPCMLQSLGSQRGRHNLATEQQQFMTLYKFQNRVLCWLALSGLYPYVLKEKKGKENSLKDWNEGNTQLRKINFIQEIFKADNCWYLIKWNYSPEKRAVGGFLSVKQKLNVQPEDQDENLCVLYIELAKIY